MCKALMYIGLILLFLGSTSASLTIHEIMYAPSTGSEWFEIYNPDVQEYNLTNWTLEDNSEIDQLTCCPQTNCTALLAPQQYLLILPQNVNLSFFNLTSSS